MRRRPAWIRPTVALLAGTACWIAASAGTWRASTGAERAADAAAAAAFAAVCLLLPRLLRRRGEGAPADAAAASEFVPAAVLLALAGFTALCRAKSFVLVDWMAPGAGPFGAGRALFLPLAAACALPFARVRSRRWLGLLLPALFVAAEIACAEEMLRLTDWGALPVWSDDHPSFLFRLCEFSGSFPWRENFVPHWNGGVVNSVISSSGVAGYALAAAPVWALAPAPHAAQPWALAFLFAFLAPWAAVWAFRTAGLGRDGAFAGGVLALCANGIFLQWALSFGTAGAAVSWSFLVPSFLFLHAVACGRRTRGAVAGLLLSAFLAAQWPQLWIALAVAAACAGATVLARRDGRSFGVLAACAALLAALLLPTALSVLGAKDLVGYVLSPAGETVRPATGCAENLLRCLYNVFAKTPPLVLAFGLAGALAMPWRRLRRWTLACLAACAAVWTAGPRLAPNMQLERYTVPFALLLAVPAACLLRRLWRSRAPALAGLQGAALAFLVLGCANAARIWGGRTSYYRFRPAPEWVLGFAGWIGENVPEDGRVMFAGLTDLDYGGGHAAYLPVLAGREMLAADWYGFPPGTFDPRLPPDAFAERPGGEGEFLRLMGVSHVATRNPRRAEEMRAKAELYEEVAPPPGPRRRPVAVFRAKPFEGRVLEGRARVRAGFNRIEISVPPEETGGALLLSYRWQDRFAADPPAAIAPREAGPGLTLLEVRPNGATNVVVRYRPRF